ncbi:MAG: ParB N-terminal domain-containing protein [Gemmatimonadales bacterium]|nr:ParB N-terminal domain-containing protein [Gemmatimonadales bacterium]
MSLRNRIIGYGEVDPSDLLANPRNPRIHPKAQQDALAGSLEEVGWVRDVLVNRVTGHVVDGHARVALALRRGESTVPVSYVDLTPKEEALVLASLDHITGLAGIDNEQLDALLREVSTGNAALQEMFSEMAQSVGLLGDLDGVGDDDGPAVDAGQFGVTVLCEDEHDQRECFKRLSRSGYTCRLMVV